MYFYHLQTCSKNINRIGTFLFIRYTLERIDTTLCLQKRSRIINDNERALPESIYPSVPTIFAFDNIYRLEETASGAGTSHRINGIIVQKSL